MRFLYGIKQKGTMKSKNKKPMIIGIVSAFVIMAMLTGCSGDTASAKKSRGNLKEADSTSADLVIPISGISEDATFYPMEVEGIALEVIAVKDSKGTIRTAFNTCQICYDSGRGYYEQSGDVLVCQNCGNRFQMDQVEVQPGGCNPWPIFEENKTVDDENITIAYDFLEDATVIFENWKGEY